MLRGAGLAAGQPEDAFGNDVELNFNGASANEHLRDGKLPGDRIARGIGEERRGTGQGQCRGGGLPGESGVGDLGQRGTDPGLQAVELAQGFAQV